MNDLILCASCSAETPDSERCASCGAPPYLMDRYVLLSCVGSGSFGTTYRAKRLQDGAIFAIKEMLVRRAESLKVMELFEREAQILERLGHPGVPRYVEDFIHEAGRNTAFYLVQEYVVGETLSEAMAGPTQPDEVFQVCRQVLEILIYLHSFSPPVIHRDIKLDNIMRRDDGSLVLIDFGSVRAALDSTVGGSTVAGTFGYMAPEQFLGRALPQTDVYGVGACAVAMLSNLDPQSLLKEDRTLDLSRLRLSAHFDFALQEMLKASPSERPDARAALELLQTPNPLEAKPAPKPSPSQTTASVRSAWASSARAAQRRNAMCQLTEILQHPLPRPIPKSLTQTYFPSHRAYTVVGLTSVFLASFSFSLVALALRMPTSTTWWPFLALGATALFGAMGLIILFAAYYLRRQMFAVWENGRVGEATILAIEKHGKGTSGRRLSKIDYEYFVSQDRYVGTWSTWLKLDLEVGQRVPVLVRSERPERSLLLATTPADFHAQLPRGANSGFLLRVRNDDGTSQDVEVSGKMRVGRTAGNDIVIPSTSVSRHHAEFDLVGDSLYVLDLGSANGVQNNDKSVDKKAPLKDGDVITIGNSQITVQKK